MAKIILPFDSFNPCSDPCSSEVVTLPDMNLSVKEIITQYKSGTLNCKPPIFSGNNPIKSFHSFEDQYDFAENLSRCIDKYKSEYNDAALYNKLAVSEALEVEKKSKKETE